MFLDLVVKYIKERKLVRASQVTFAAKFLKSVGDKPVDPKLFEEEAGVGVELTPQQVKDAVTKIIQEVCWRDEQMRRTGRCSLRPGDRIRRL